MSQLSANPIQQKLSKIKMRSSKTYSLSEQTQTTPLKIQQWVQDKDSLTIQTMSQQASKCKRSETNSLRKLGLLERKWSRKGQVNCFYLQEINRRKRKYQKQLIEGEQKMEGQITRMQDGLVDMMKKQNKMDDEGEFLESLIQCLNNGKINNCHQLLGELSEQTLMQIQNMLESLGIKANDLRYSIDTSTPICSARIPVKPNEEMLLNQKYDTPSISFLIESNERDFLLKK